MVVHQSTEQCGSMALGRGSRMGPSKVLSCTPSFLVWIRAPLTEEEEKLALSFTGNLLILLLLSHAAYFQKYLCILTSMLMDLSNTGPYACPKNVRQVYIMMNRIWVPWAELV